MPNGDFSVPTRSYISEKACQCFPSDLLNGGAEQLSARFRHSMWACIGWQLDILDLRFVPVVGYSPFYGQLDTFLPDYIGQSWPNFTLLLQEVLGKKAKTTNRYWDIRAGAPSTQVWVCAIFDSGIGLRIRLLASIILS